MTQALHLHNTLSFTCMYSRPTRVTYSMLILIHLQIELLMGAAILSVNACALLTTQRQPSPGQRHTVMHIAAA